MYFLSYLVIFVATQRGRYTTEDNCLPQLFETVLKSEVYRPNICIYTDRSLEHLLRHVSSCLYELLTLNFEFEQVGSLNILLLRNFQLFLFNSFSRLYCDDNHISNLPSKADIRKIIKTIILRLEEFIYNNISMINQIPLYNMNDMHFDSLVKFYSSRSISYEYMKSIYDRYWTNHTINNILKRIPAGDASVKVLKSIILSKIINLSCESDKRVLALIFIYICNIYKDEHILRRLIAFNLYIDCYYFNSEKSNLLLHKDINQYFTNKIHFFFKCVFNSKNYRAEDMESILPILVKMEILHHFNNCDENVDKLYLMGFGMILPYYIQKGFLYRFTYMNEIAAKSEKLTDAFINIYYLPIKILNLILCDTGILH